MVHVIKLGAFLFALVAGASATLVAVPNGGVQERSPALNAAVEAPAHLLERDEENEDGTAPPHGWRRVRRARD